MRLCCMVLTSMHSKIDSTEDYDAKAGSDRAHRSAAETCAPPLLNRI